MKQLGFGSVQALYRASVQDIGWFWDEVMKDLGLIWEHPYTQVVDTSHGFPWTRWFIDGKINVTTNCVDRHAQSALRNSPAIRWEGEDGSKRELTYGELQESVDRTCQALNTFGVQPGDVVGMTLPMLVETAVVLLACCKLGAIALPIFSGFGPKALAYRLNQTRAKVLVTTDLTYRRGKPVRISDLIGQTLPDTPELKHVCWVQRGAQFNPPPSPHPCEHHPWQTLLQNASPTPFPAAQTAAEDPCLVIYTSGTTGNPKGTVHTHAGCLAQMGKELRFAFDVHPGNVLYWFTDIGWMMGPWEIIGVLANGGTVLLSEGAPDFPQPDRLWRIITHHQVRTFGISPTAIRLLKKFGNEFPRNFAMPSLELLGSTGEVWDEDSYLWFFEHVGKKRCPILNISGGTEIVGCLLSPLPVMPLKPCTLGGPALGMDVDIFDEAGQPVREGIGHLVCKQPAPSMTKGFWGEPDRYLKTYFAKFPKVWYHGDWASRDSEGFWYLHGRSDDTLMIAGKRVGPAELENRLMLHTAVAEAAAIGIPDALKGESVVCFVVLRPSQTWSEGLHQALVKLIADELGKSLLPKAIYPVQTLPKTRSAKIVRSLIRQAYLHEPLGDLTSVENPDSLKEFQELKTS
jgi:acetyl-CoA synthetase